MSSIFLSYKRGTDAERVGVVRTKLEAIGLDMFQDVDMSAGSYFRDVLKEQIRASTAVLVLWTRSSLKSPWVSDEAQRGLEAEKLVAVTFDGIEPSDLPLPFGGVQTPDLSDWIEGGARIEHASWRSVLKALGVLFKRPLPEIADIVETRSMSMKTSFIRKYPNDPFSAGLIGELRTAKLDEFQKQLARAKQLSDARRVGELRRLDQLGTGFAKLVEAALSDGTLETLDAKKIIQTTVKGSRDTRQSDDSSDGENAASEQIARMQSEIESLRESKLAADNAKAEIADTAAGLNLQLEDSKRELLDFQNRLAQTKAPFDSQTPAGIEQAPWQRSALPWLAVLFGAFVGAGMLWILIEPDSLGKDNKQLADQVSEATTKLADKTNALEALGKEKARIATQLKDVTTNLAEANATVDALRQNNKALSDRADDTAKKLVAASTARDASGKEEKLSAELRDAMAKLADANATVDALRQNNKSLSDRADESGKKFVAASTARDALGTEKEKVSALLDDATRKLADVNATVESLRQNNKSLSDRADESGKKFVAASIARDALGMEKEKLSVQLKDATTKLADTKATADALKNGLDDSARKLTSANTKIDSLSQELAKNQNAEEIRAASEARCDELAAYETDLDLPSGRKAPSRPSKAQEVIDNCSAALGSLPKQTSRRLLLQLSRGYIMQGHAFRQNAPASANSYYSTAVSLAKLASDLGSAQADALLGYIFNGGFNVPKFNYVFANTPDYPYAWARFKASASANNALGLLYAGSFLLWPACSLKTAPFDPATGLGYLHQAQDKKIASAYYAEGFYLYFGTASQGSRANGLFDKANALSSSGGAKDFASLNEPLVPAKPAFLVPPKPQKPDAVCPAVVFE